MVLRKSFYIRWSAGRSPRVHEVNPGRDPSVALCNNEGGLRCSEPKGKIMVVSGLPQRSPLRCGLARSPIPKQELEKSDFLGH